MMNKIVILGGAESGVGAAVLAKKQGCDVFVSDMGAISPMYQALLDKHSIAWESGQHTEALILDADEVMLNSAEFIMGRCGSAYR